VYALQRTRTKCGVLASYKAREIDGQSVTDYLGSTRIPLAETSEGHDSFLNTFECLLRILSRRRCRGHGHRFRSHRSTAYGRGGGVGRGLGVGANLGVGVGLAVAVGVALAVAVAVAVGVGVGLPPPTKLNLPMRVFQPAL
jgi:hypothetical protein